MRLAKILITATTLLGSGAVFAQGTNADDKSELFTRDRIQTNTIGLWTQPLAGGGLRIRVLGGIKVVEALLQSLESAINGGSFSAVQTFAHKGMSMFLKRWHDRFKINTIEGSVCPLWKPIADGLDPVLGAEFDVTKYFPYEIIGKAIHQTFMAVAAQGLCDPADPRTFCYYGGEVTDLTNAGGILKFVPAIEELPYEIPDVPGFDRREDADTCSELNWWSLGARQTRWDIGSTLYKGPNSPCYNAWNRSEAG